MRTGCLKSSGGKSVWKRRFIVLSVSLLLGAASGNALALTNASVSHLQQIVERAVNYAITNEDVNTARFNQRYKYTRTQTKVYHNEAGKVTDLKKTQSQENTNAAKLNSAVDSLQNLIKGRDFILKPYPITNIVARFDFTLTGEEIVAGRRAYVISFFPRQNLSGGFHLYDPFINKTKGMVWVDAEDYAVAKAQFHLIPPIKVVFGLVGQIDAFSCVISRSRTPEGFWFVRTMEWHLDQRLITVRRVIDYHDERIHQLPIVSNH